MSQQKLVIAVGVMLSLHELVENVVVKPDIRTQKVIFLFLKEKENSHKILAKITGNWPEANKVQVEIGVNDIFLRIGLPLRDNVEIN